MRVLATAAALVLLATACAVAQDGKGVITPTTDFKDQVPDYLFKAGYYVPRKEGQYFVNAGPNGQLTARMLDPTPLAEPVLPPKAYPPVVAKD